MKIDEIFNIFHNLNPKPITELHYTNNFTLLVAIILSAQSTDISVNKATKSLFISYNSPEKMLALGEDGLKAYIKTIGLFNNKAKNIIKLCEILITLDLNQIKNIDDLINLPGVGRKTANVYLNNFYGLTTIGVDTHVARVARRLGLSGSKSISKIEKDLLKVIPTKWLKNAHNWMVLHGRYVCQAKKPLCVTCPINHLCNKIDVNSI